MISSRRFAMRRNLSYYDLVRSSRIWWKIQTIKDYHSTAAGYQFLQHICLYISFGLLLIRAYLNLAGGLCTNGILLKEGSSLMMMMMSTSKNKLSGGKLRNLVSGLDRDVECHLLFHSTLSSCSYISPDQSLKLFSLLPVLLPQQYCAQLYFILLRVSIVTCQLTFLPICFVCSCVEFK
ncbi:hypothetical protein PVAP13_1NG058844 [Panicum virgatum]|uniref:Uncharacterized protein n=1 Tax=Panicum virgatum TaxID=38727 RepID=A0A8T0WTY8_PANVG|nr:hypothetical protein PVAP13_1NG058844 [Panicum virgatum]